MDQSDQLAALRADAFRLGQEVMQEAAALAVRRMLGLSREQALIISALIDDVPVAEFQPGE